MKRRDLLKRITEMGCIFIRHGGKHDWYQNPKTRISQPVPRHNEIKEYLARHIIKILENGSLQATILDRYSAVAFTRRSLAVTLVPYRFKTVIKNKLFLSFPEFLCRSGE